MDMEGFYIELKFPDTVSNQRSACPNRNTIN